MRIPSGVTYCPQRNKLAFLCACGRGQSYAPSGKPGGCTVAEAEQVGWRFVDNKWVCPFCSGNEKDLEQVFKKGKK